MNNVAKILLHFIHSTHSDDITRPQLDEHHDAFVAAQASAQAAGRGMWSACG
jgi:endonuclease YncB( thermonuclease family)